MSIYDDLPWIKLRLGEFAMPSEEPGEPQEGASLPSEISPGLITYVSGSSASVRLPEMSEGQSITIRNIGSEPLMVYEVDVVTDEPDRRRFRGIPIHIKEQLISIEEMVHDLWDVAKGAAYPSLGYAVPRIFWDRAIGYLTEVRRRTEEACRHESAPEIVAHDWRYAAKAVTIDTTDAGLREAGYDPDGDRVPLPQKPQPEEKPYIPQKWGEH